MIHESRTVRQARREAYQARNGSRARGSAVDFTRIENLIMLVEGALVNASRPLKARPRRNRELEAAQRIAREMGRLARRQNQ